MGDVVDDLFVEIRLGRGVIEIVNVDFSWALVGGDHVIVDDGDAVDFVRKLSDLSKEEFKAFAWTVVGGVTQPKK